MKVYSTSTVPRFDVNLSASKRFRATQPNEHDFLRNYFFNSFIPYIRKILAEHPEYTPADLEQHIKIDITELSEAIFSTSGTYHLYLDTIAREYLMSNPAKLEEIVSIVKSPDFDTTDKINRSRYAGTFQGTLMTYVLELLPEYEKDYERYIAHLPAGYLSQIESAKKSGKPLKVILDNITKKYKKEYNYDFISYSDFEASARIAIYGFPEYIRTDKVFLDNTLRKTLSASILELNSQFEKFGFTERAQQIRKSSLAKLGLLELAEKLDANTLRTENQIRGAINSLSIADLLAYNTYLTNRYSKEADSLAASFFLAYQYKLLPKFFDPEVQKFLGLIDRINTHTETDSSQSYITDKDSPYPTKADLKKILSALYSSTSYTSLLSRISPLPQARVDSSKVSIPGLLHELKQVYPTREDFDRGMQSITAFTPTIPEYQIVLDKMAFLRNPTRLYMQRIQSEISDTSSTFETYLSPEEELETFGNQASHENIIRYSYGPYQRLMHDAYGSEYNTYFSRIFSKIPKYHSTHLHQLPKSDIQSDAHMFLRCYTPIHYSYESKNDFINSLLAVMINERDFSNAGVILDNISPDGTRASIGRKIGIGLDPHLTSGIQVHAITKAAIDFLEEYNGNCIVPIYEGMDDFQYVSSQAVCPFTKPLSKYLKTAVKNPNLSPTAQRYISRIYSLSTGNVPDHLLTTVPKSAGSKKVKKIFKRRYVDLKTGVLYELVNGEYVPVQPEPTKNLKLPQNRATGGTGYEH